MTADVSSSMVTSWYCVKSYISTYDVLYEIWLRVSATTLICVLIRAHLCLTLHESGVAADNNPFHLCQKAWWLNLSALRTASKLFSLERAADGERSVVMPVCVCVVWGWVAERVTVAYEQVSDSEKHQIRGQVLSQLAAIDSSSTSHQKDHWSAKFTPSLVIITRGTDTLQKRQS